MRSSIVTGKSSIFQTKINEENSVSKDLCVIIGFTIIGNASSNCDICDDLLHFIKYSGICKLANFVNVIKKVLDITNFWQSTADSSKLDLNLWFWIFYQNNNFLITMSIYYQNLSVTLKVNWLWPLNILPV